MTEHVERITEIDRAIGARLRAVRVARGLSQTQLGEALGLTYQQVQKYEAGKNRLSCGAAWRAALFLQVEIGALFEGLPGDDLENPVEPLPSYSGADRKLIDAARRLPSDMRKGLTSFCTLIADGMDVVRGDSGIPFAANTGLAERAQ